MNAIADRFWRKVRRDQPTGCWEWLAATNSDGYGHFFYEGSVIGAHRVSWMLHHGAIPEGALVCHHCDNPRCVNPAHLFLGTHQDNATDKVVKGRHAWGNKTHCIRGHPLSGDNLYVTKKRGLRMCRECGRMREQARRTTDRTRRSDYGKIRAA